MTQPRAGTTTETIALTVSGNHVSTLRNSPTANRMAITRFPSCFRTLLDGRSADRIGGLMVGTDAARSGHIESHQRRLQGDSIVAAG